MKIPSKDIATHAITFSLFFGYPIAETILHR